MNERESAGMVTMTEAELSRRMCNAANAISAARRDGYVAALEIERLQAEVIRLSHARGREHDASYRLRAEVARLREALATIASHDTGMRADFSVGARQARIAREALETPPAPGSTEVA
jgi:hypothetical protein